MIFRFEISVFGLRNEVYGLFYIYPPSNTSKFKNQLLSIRNSFSFLIIFTWNLFLNFELRASVFAKCNDCYWSKAKEKPTFASIN